MLKKFLEDHSIQNSPARTIYQCIYYYGPLTQARLCEMTKLNRLKVMRILDELIQHSYIQKAGYDQSSGGRRPLLYQVCSKSSYIIGVNLTRTHTRITLFDLLLNVMEDKYFLMTIKHTPSVVLEEINGAIQNLMNHHHFSYAELLGISIASIGPFDRDRGTILRPELFLAPGWENVPIIDKIKEMFPVKVLLENTPSAAALGEYRYLKDVHRNILYCLNGWVWACGVITDGKLVRMSSGDVNGYGHMVIHAGGRTCSCGSRGCAVAYSSLNAIMQEIEQKEPSLLGQSWGEEGYPDIDEMIRFLIEEREHVEQIVMSSAYYFGIGVANLASILQSTMVILGGPLVDSYPGYFEKAAETAEQHIRYGKNRIIFSRENLKGRSAVVGAAASMLDSFME